MYVGVCGVVVWWLVCFVRIVDVDVDVDVMCGGTWWLVCFVLCTSYLLACLAWSYVVWSSPALL